MRAVSRRVGNLPTVLLVLSGGWWADCPPYSRRAVRRTSPDRGMAILGPCGALYGRGVIGRLRGVQVEIVSPARGAGLAMSGAFGLIPGILVLKAVLVILWGAV